MRTEAQKEYQKHWYRANRDRHIALQLVWQEKNKSLTKTYNRKSKLKNNFGITEDDYTKMFLAQNGLCAICQTDIPGTRTKHFCVDHCHETGKIRGLLCVNCNSGLGFFEDSLTLMERATKYLKAS